MVMASENCVPDLTCKNDSSEDSEDESDWQEVDSEDDTECAMCLFCPQMYRTTSEAVSHCCTDHKFDLVKLKARFNMDCYGYIRLVNYIRIHRPLSSDIMACTEPIWDCDEYMKPASNNDPWLMYDFDDIEVPAPLKTSETPSGGFHVNAEDGCVTLSEQHFSELQQTIQQLTLQFILSNSQLNVMMERFKELCEDKHNLIADKGDGVSHLAHSVKDVRLEDDEGYFNTYSHFSIHHEMLSDEVRTSSYRDALLQNSSGLKGKTVLDLGCGTGILSMFAASAGAEKVIAIDQSDIIYHAMDIVRENNLSKKIDLVKGRLEDTELPQKNVDVIVSEWMGYFLFFEGMLDSVIYARDHHLAEGGMLLPNRYSVSMAGIGDSARHGQLIGFWSDVYGYRMSCLQHEVVREAMVEIVPQDKFSANLNLEVTNDGTLTALVGYFDAFFDLPHAVSFSTGPHSKPTHWKQTVFLLEEPVAFKKGDVVSGKVVCQRNQKDIRSLIITLSILGKKLKYVLN
ncbi:hypothetical protein L9F63_003670 [Diploptera punctata]|uniref:type I protein arginine methyltransferase n=1 Tax=Diploptera punctata TaxID=6984 RepID=A0AAD8E965_DIPPU|nr:hypothetical protein L9F63_003670 [Diploptera punctata]